MQPNQILVHPIRIRDGVVVKVHLPADLTKQEAEKVSRVIMAMVDLRDAPNGA